MFYWLAWSVNFEKIRSIEPLASIKPRFSEVRSLYLGKMDSWTSGCLVPRARCRRKPEHPVVNLVVKFYEVELPRARRRRKPEHPVVKFQKKKFLT